MNNQDEISIWEELTTSVAEARPLVTSFEMLEDTVDQQIRAMRFTLLVLASLLCVAVTSLALPKSFHLGIQEAAFAFSIVVVFGLISTFSVYFNLRTCVRNAQTARRSLERELQDADYSMSTEYEARSTTVRSTGGEGYAT